MMLHYNIFSQKLFTKLNIFLGFMVIFLVQLGFSFAFFQLRLTGPSVFGTCGVFLPVNSSESLVPVIMFQAQSSLTCIFYGVSIFCGIKIMLHIRQLSANLYEGFQVELSTDWCFLFLNVKRII